MSELDRPDKANSRQEFGGQTTGGKSFAALRLLMNATRFDARQSSISSASAPLNGIHSPELGVAI